MALRQHECGVNCAARVDVDGVEVDRSLPLDRRPRAAHRHDADRSCPRPASAPLSRLDERAQARPGARRALRRRLASDPEERKRLMSAVGRRARISPVARHHVRDGQEPQRTTQLAAARGGATSSSTRATSSRTTRRSSRRPSAASAFSALLLTGTAEQPAPTVGDTATPVCRYRAILRRLRRGLRA